MASSSVSQESLDFDDDFDSMARRNRIRTHRGRIVPHRSGDREGGGDFHDRDGGRDQHCGDIGDGADHDSPTRGAAARLKDKQRNRVNHHKGKPGPKDKRKLREKRRSTGVVHLPSTESTGDSLDEDDDESNMNQETKKNTAFNESTTSHSHGLHHHHHHHHHHGQHTYESIPPAGSFLPRGNKSPSDLEADLEDNQDYDSTVSHSETNLTLIGRSESSDTHKLSGVRSYKTLSGYSKFSPEASRASSAPRCVVASQAASSDQDAKITPPSSALSKSSVSALVSKYAFSTDPEPCLQRDPGSISKDAGTSRVAGFGAPKDSWRPERSFGTNLPSRINEQEQESSEKGSNSNGSTSSAGGSYYTSRFSFQSARPFSAQPSSATADGSGYIQKQLDKEKDENKKLQQQLEQKDKRIAELERIVTMLNRECDDLDVDNVKLQEENKALIRAMQQLSSNM
ncbi:uncharacterized protein LOC143283341 [Babylonia areolata]|uniref:uncharacterized protein LOC143283341 n=1 Tax=Babylonia areolata TaxID=304850 RepID=UPI003FCF3B4A